MTPHHAAFDSVPNQEPPEQEKGNILAIDDALGGDTFLTIFLFLVIQFVLFFSFISRCPGFEGLSLFFCQEDRLLRKGI